MHATLAKIAFSEQELLLANNREWILTKHSIISKVEQLLANLITHQQHTFAPILNNCTNQSPNPKISKGEKYQLLPYVILDYPRIFSTTQTLAIRCMFWWGNFYSISLQLSGDFQQNHTEHLIKNFALLQQHDFYISVHTSPWEHDFLPQHTISLNNWQINDFTFFIQRHPFIKITKKIPLKQWDEVTIFFEQHYEILVKILTN
ncbi:MAG: hypothetical protein RLY16_2088 [Bacteroidota bacterium]|jgi:hypothetical protein